MSFESDKGMKGTPAYISPEQIRDYTFSKASDVYSYGIMAYEILAGKYAYYRENLYKLLGDIMEGKRPEFDFPISDSYKNIIEKCWADDMNNRPSFDEIVDLLKNDALLKDIDISEFYEYADFIDSYNKGIVKEANFHKVESTIEKPKKDESEIVISPDVKQVDLDKFERKHKIGKGGFARVYKVIEKSTKKIYAAKIMMNELSDLDKSQKKNLAHELEVISSINYVSVMKFIGYSLTNFNNKEKPVIISEILPNGSLAGILDLENHKCGIKGWDNTKKFINIYCVASAMKYLHSKNILHRDLKPDNVLLDEYLYPKLSDFGLSKYLKISEVDETQTLNVIGTPPYISPEIWTDTNYTDASDVYAFAMIIYEILTNEKPAKQFKLPEIIYYQVIFKHYRPKLTESIPKCYKNLIEKCWAEDPDERPTFDEIIDLLKTDPEFIFKDVDMEEFINYTRIIGEEFNKKEEEKEVEKEVDTSKYTQVLVKFEVPDVKERISEHTITTFNRVAEEEMKSMSIQNYFIDLNDYEFKELIRKSEINKIYKVIQKRTGKTYSAKISNIDMTQFSEEEMTRTAREFNKISQLNHQTILKFVGFSPTSFKKEPKPVVITELYPSISLGDILQMDKNDLKIREWDSTKKLMILYGIASAMKYLHSHDIVHRNLKPSNIIVDDSLLPKLSDFGICTHLLMMNSMTFQTASKIRGSSIYSAPEVVISGECTKESDVYSFAMIAYEMLNKEKPIVNVGKNSGFVSNALEKIKRPEFKVSIPECYKNLIESGWSEDPNERQSFEDIVYELENNPNFITSDIDKDKYLDYVKKL
ncbi:hypothetical protein M9Y10_030307 [Tritrichomonas musculus]|uniref:Protein kinase domain-containing protein n=1 Tax=Tritrichomonas musculus TaxID=1915356 RepID=A0ABR2KPG1_9EUKA